MKAVIFFVLLDLFSLSASFITPLQRKSVKKNNTSIKNISRKKQLITTALQLYSLVLCCQISASSPQGMNTRSRIKLSFPLQTSSKVLFIKLCIIASILRDIIPDAR